MREGGASIRRGGHQPMRKSLFLAPVEEHWTATGRGRSSGGCPLKWRFAVCGPEAAGLPYGQRTTPSSLRSNCPVLFC
ncbi:hypothetical protein SKAU_G00078850 [Synaphobranchus kaupii]|uniref:Uncharacterized protein n=1 Tax=Synaphobranchus kaupii TaxID=118154 RepID=A0A9Q1FUJ9_SYNKA|nr:hypothetical protein SKAU_G00078850 [Synaphobranchus kaupii]